MKAVVFGATTSAKSIYDEIKKQYDIVAFADNDIKKQGGSNRGKVNCRAG